MENYLEINRHAWNSKVDTHLQSDFYFLEEFVAGKTSLNSIELSLLGDVSGKDILHLQCHFGQDSIALSRLGANVTGMDLSDKAITAAKALAMRCGTDTQFINSDVYDLPNVLDQKFDIVYASYGTIGWLPDLEKWAQVISHFLRPGGKFIFVEFHPVRWMFDDDFEYIKYNYFNVEEIVEVSDGTYADRNAPIQEKEISWNHPISEVLTSLLNQKLQLQSFDEYDWSPYSCFRHSEMIDENKFQISKFGNKIPLVYSLVAQRNF